MEKSEKKETIVSLNKAVEEFVECTKRTILPFDQLAYETILSVLELSLVRNTANEIMGTGAILRNVQNTGTAELDKQVLDIIDDVRNELDTEVQGQ